MINTIARIINFFLNFFNVQLVKKTTAKKYWSKSMQMVKIDDHKINQLLESINEPIEKTNEKSLSEFLLNNISSTYDKVDIREVLKVMGDLWVLHNYKEKSMINFASKALCNDYYINKINYIKQNIDLVNKRVLDTGCGWGSLSLLLVGEGADVIAVDWIHHHACVTKMRVPEAEVYTGDVRNLSEIKRNSVDVVISSGLIEHIGAINDPRGPAGSSITDKTLYMREVSRVLKKGGTGFLSTGNFLFPRDGEVDKWLFHWLPKKCQEKWLEITAESADLYWLLTWDQLKNIFYDAGLKIKKVISPDIEHWRNYINQFTQHFDGLPENFEDIIMELVTNEPKYMSSWFLLFEK